MDQTLSNCQAEVTVAVYPSRAGNHRAVAVHKLTRVLNAEASRNCLVVYSDALEPGFNCTLKSATIIILGHPRFKGLRRL